MERSGSSKKPRAVSLPDDLIAEILARVPYRSLCRFKSVLRSWLAICSDPGVRRKCPQTLAGFFFHSMPFGSSRFVNASGRSPPVVDPSLSFLPPGHTDACIVDSCNRLLLCGRKNTYFGSRYFVCNPSTEKWVELPETRGTKKIIPIIRLGFDPAVSLLSCLRTQKITPSRGIK